MRTVTMAACIIALFALRLQDPVRLEEPARVLDGSPQAVLCLAFSPDGRRIAAGSTDRTVRIYAVESGMQVRVLGGNVGAVTGVAFSPDGKRLAAASWGALLFDPDTGKQLDTLEAHTGFTTCAAYSSDGRILVTGALDGTARAWDARSGLEVRLFAHPGGVSALSLSGSRLITCGDTGLKVWDTASGKEVRDVPLRDISAADLSPDGQTLALAMADGSIRLLQTDSWTEKGFLAGHKGRALAVRFSPDGKLLASGSDDKTARVWRVSDRKPVAVLAYHEGPVHAVAFSPDGTLLATASEDKLAAVWDIRKLQNTGEGGGANPHSNRDPKPAAAE